MRLADFIRRDMNTIVAKWEEFAATRLPAAHSMTRLELRDHAREILEAIATDLDTPQTREEQDLKSKGLAPFSARETAAQTHAVLRARSGFDIRQLASEYRALRASVLSLWSDTIAPAAPDPGDVIRFNEAIDQALTESIGHFSDQVEQARNLLLGMLSHDMRTPLQAIQTTAAYLRRLNAGEQVWAAAQRLIDSGKRVQLLLDDLMDFNRSNLGVGIPVTPEEVDLGRLCAEQLAELRAAHPGRDIELAVSGDCHGRWDRRRLQQVVGNLAANALTHGDAGSAVRIVVSRVDSDVQIEVRNRGSGLSSIDPRRLFEPLARGADADPRSGLGLGLYIVREIARAHGGRVEARCADGETVFTVRLPVARIATPA